MTRRAVALATIELPDATIVAPGEEFDCQEADYDQFKEWGVIQDVEPTGKAAKRQKAFIAEEAPLPEPDETLP